MRMKNKKVRVFSFILAILILFTSNISVYANPIGSGVGPKNPSRHGNYTSHSTKKGAATSVWGLRIRAFEVDDFIGNDYDYFTISKTRKGDRISLVKNVSKVKSHKENNEWIYITPLNKSRKYSFYLGGEEFTAVTEGTDSDFLKKLKNVLGITDATIFSNWDKQIRAYDNYGRGHEKDDELAGLLNVKKGSDYFIVIEGLRAMVDLSAQTSGDDYSSKFIWTSYQDYVYDSNAKKIMSCQTPIDATADKWLENAENYINQGSIPPFGIKYTENQPIKTGFCVYGDINPSTAEPFSLNIAVEYKGEPNTNDGDFVAASSLIKQEGGKYSYWDIEKNTWVESSKESEILQTSKGISTKDPYTVVLEDYYYIQNDEKNLTASKLINSGDLCNSDYSITWGNKQVSTGNVNIGYSIRPIALDGKNSTSAIMSKFKSVLNNNTESKGRTSNSNFNSLSIIKACIDNVNLAYYKTSDDAVGTVKSTGEAKLRKKKQLGTAIELIVKGSEITSHKVTVKVDPNGVASSSETWNDTYSSAGSTSVDISSNAVCFVAVPNTNRDDDAVVASLNGSTDINANLILSKVENALTNTKIAQVNNGISIGLGCENNLDGYTIYEVLVADKPVRGAVELPAYMLNRYYKNIIQTSSLNQVLYQLNKDFTVIKEDYTGESTCGRCGSVLKPITKPLIFDDWRVEWKDVSGGTKHTDYDNDLRSRYFVKMNSGTWSKCDRITLANWVSEDTRNWSNPSGFIMDYGFNLIRASVNDMRAISGISYPSYDVIDADNLLHYKFNFGVVPAEMKHASVKRYSLATVGTVSDTLTMQSRFTRYSGDGYNEKLESHDHEEIGHWTEGTEDSPSYYVVDEPAVHISYYTFPKKSALGFRKNMNATNILDYTFDSTVYKYETDTIADGKNNSIVSKDNVALRTSANKAEKGAVGGTNEYRFANVRYNGIIHNFYPEVNMVTCIGGKDWNSVVNTGYKSVATMGEVIRKSKSSSLYMFKLNGIGENSITGTTYSDSAQGGTSSKGSSNVIIPAGSDVYVNADPNGITIDLYGYALDCIDADIDSTFSPSSNYTRKYTDIVKSGVNVDTIWNNHSNKGILEEHFSKWVDAILDVKNFSADFELFTDNNKKANNFSAVIGNIGRNNTITEEGVFQLQISNGVVIRNTDYVYLIRQIASDYECSESDAEALFKASGIYTSILNAIESSNSSFNHSGICDVNASWTSQLGGESNWYDEKVNTFVIRRFACEGNTINDITAVDKIDYGLAPNGNNSYNQNSNAGNVLKASWKLNIFFNPDKADTVKDLLVGSDVFYDAGSNVVSLDAAKDNYTLLVNQAPIKNADFNISATTTNDFGW